MKILLVNSIFKPYIGGGAEIVFEDHVYGFKERGYDVEVLTLAKDGTYSEDIIDEVKIFRIPVRNLYWPDPQSKRKGIVRKLWHVLDIYNIAMKHNVSKVIKESAPDLIVCHNIPGFSVSIWSVAKGLNIPIVQVLHDLSFLCPGSNMFKGDAPCNGQCLVCKCMRYFHPRISRNVDAVIGVSDFVLNRFNQYGYFKNAFKCVINNYRELNLAEITLRKNENLFNIGYIGVLSKVKGVELLIRQFMDIDNPQMRLLIAGIGISVYYEERLKKIASVDKRIKFLGYTKQTEFFSQIDVLVVPSIWPDTFPTVAIESCACFVPVIASKEGGLPEIVHDGRNGILFDVFVDGAIKKSILKLYNDRQLYSNLKENCRNEILDLLDKERVFNQYSEVFNKVISIK